MKRHGDPRKSVTSSWRYRTTAGKSVRIYNQMDDWEKRGLDDQMEEVVQEDLPEKGRYRPEEQGTGWEVVNQNTKKCLRS